MKSKIIASVLIICILSFSASAFAQYPSSSGIVDFNETYDVSQTQSWIPSDSKNIFTVDGKKFILLDTDEEGNYFVLAEDHYGTYPFELNVPNTIQLAEAVTVNGKTTFTDNNVDLSDTESWRFQPQRSSNIAYWLNNKFVLEGNTDEFKLPKKIYDNIIERDWEIEGFNSFAGWTAVQQYDNYFGVSTASDYAAAFSGNSYSVSAKISLLSYSEYMKYKDKIGITFNNSGGWAGMLLRTCDSMITCTESGNKKTLNLIRAPLMVRTKSTNTSDHGNLAIRLADAVSSDYYYVRPCFWLSSDFFKNVACDIEADENGNLSIGEVPLEKIKSHSYDELRSIYTDGQLENMGYQIPERNMGNYPVHPSQVKDLGAGEQGDTGMPEYYSSPLENLFTVDGKSFILLDRDKEGNYFVMANEEYGQRAFSTGVSSSDKQCTDNDWYFNPEDQNSIAYWLNHQFLETGGQMKNSSEMLILPQSIRDNMLVSEWEIEPHYPINGWMVGSYANENTKTEIEQWRSSQLAASQKRVVRCKVALMSYTEYQTYKEKIGLSVLSDGYGGFSLRTPRSQANAAPDGTWSVILGPLQVANNDASKKMVFTTAGVNNDTYFVRPVFWLSSDFFAKNIIDIDSVGENVKNEIAYSYDYFDMKDLYSDSQIQKLGIKLSSESTDSIPEADKVFISGVPAVGSDVTGEYHYISNDIKSFAASERNSKYAWYTSETKDGYKTKCSDTINYKPIASDVGKYLWFSVVPRNAYGISSEKEYFSRPVLIEDYTGIEVESVKMTDNNGHEVFNLNGTPVLNFCMKIKSQSDCVMFISAYSQDGKMIALKSEPILPGINTKEVQFSGLSAGGGSYLRVMIFNNNDLTKPIYSKKI